MSFLDASAFDNALSRDEVERRVHAWDEQVNFPAGNQPQTIDPRLLAVTPQQQQHTPPGYSSPSPPPLPEVPEENWAARLAELQSAVEVETHPSPPGSESSVPETQTGMPPAMQKPLPDFQTLVPAAAPVAVAPVASAPAASAPAATATAGEKKSNRVGQPPGYTQWLRPHKQRCGFGACTSECTLAASRLVGPAKTTYDNKVAKRFNIDRLDQGRVEVSGLWEHCHEGNGKPQLVRNVRRRKSGGRRLGVASPGGFGVQGAMGTAGIPFCL